MQAKSLTATGSRRHEVFPAGGTPSVSLIHDVVIRDSTTGWPIVRGPNGRKGFNPHSYVNTHQRAFAGSITARQDYGQRLLQSETSGNLSSMFSLGATASQRDQAYNQALQSLNSLTRGGVNLTVDMAESHQLAKMFRSLRRLEQLTAGIGVKAWANRWLEYTYGWMPLVSSIYGAADELQNVVVNRIVRHRARATVPIGPENLPSKVFVFNNEFPRGDFQIDLKGEVRCEIVVLLDVFDSTNRATRWASMNPLGIAWELMPYSFVFDWVVDIGSYLEDLETAVKLAPTFRSGYVSESSNVSCMLTLANRKRNVPGTDYFYNVQGHYRASTLTRNVLGNYPFPRLPRVNANLGWRRWTSAASLLRQRFS